MSAGSLRMSVHVALVLLVMRSRHPKPVYGMELVTTIGLHAGTVYPILHRLSHHGWLDCTWEADDPARGRPRRCYYTLTSSGLRGAAGLDNPPVLKALTTDLTRAPGNDDAHG